MNVQDLDNIRKNLEKRLQIRRIQAAKKGVDTNPEIIIEMEDLIKAIKAIKPSIELAIKYNIPDIDTSTFVDVLRGVNVII